MGSTGDVGAIVPSEVEAPARATTQPRPQTVIIKRKGGFWGPVGTAIALTIVGFVAFNAWNIYQSSEERRVEHSKPVHRDQSEIVINVGSTAKRLPQAGEVEFFLKQEDGKLYRVIAQKTARDRFVNETLKYLQDRQERVLARADTELDAAFTRAFADKEASINAYADWFFAWGRSWQLLWKSITGAVNEGVKVGLSRTRIMDAARHEVEAYLIHHYKEFVLKPETRESEITRNVRDVFKEAHREYRYTIAGLDDRLQRFLAEHTRFMEEVEPAKAVSIKLDWDAQQWKAPRYAAEDAAMEGVTSVGLIAGSTFVLGPTLEALILPLFAEVTGEIMTSTELAVGGAILGSEVPILGNLLGLAAGVAADYALSYFRDHLNRDDFVKANHDAVDATIREWKELIVPHLRTAVTSWFDDAQRAVVVEEK